MTNWNKVYRGGVQRTTPETREALYTGAAAVLPGTAAALSVANGIKPQPAAGEFFYLVGENLHTDIDTAYVQGETVRMYSPRSGDLYAVRAAAGIAIVDDLPLTINALGRFEEGTPGTDYIAAYVDNPASAHPQTLPATTVADQIIPVKIK